MANPNAIPMVPQSAAQGGWKLWLQRGIVSAISLFFMYIVLVMYSQGEPLFAVVTLLFTTAFAYIFLFDRAYVWRYVFSGLAGMMLFIVFPILYTLGIGFTNYSNLHLISFEQAQSYFLNQTYAAEDGANYDLVLYEDGTDYRITVENENTGDTYVATDSVPMTHTEQITLELEASGPLDSTLANLQPAPRNAAILLRSELDRVMLVLPDGTELMKSRLTQFSTTYPLYELNDNGNLVNQQDGSVISPNFEAGYFEDENGQRLNPGFTVNVGFDNIKRVLTDKGMFDPFVQIFTWTMLFSAFTVVATFIIGVTLASLVQWEPIRGRALYQLLLILPYALPSFISIMIFKALFNQNFGEINFILESLFGIAPNWNSNPNTTRAMILFVNTWLGYPYMFILCLGMLQSIPKDLYEASGLEGSGMFNNFFRITLPLILKPLLPLLIASFAFNFNNFVLIELLTKGGPIIIGSNPQAGETDLLVNYAYRLAFRGDTQDFALASTISTFIFMIVAVIAFLYLKVAKVEVGVKNTEESRMIKTREHKARVIGAHLVLIVFLAFVIYPLAYLVSVSFRTGHTLVDTIIPSNPTLEHWYLAFEQPYVGMNPQKKDLDGVDSVTFNNALGDVTFNADGSWTLTAAPRVEAEYFPLRSYLSIGFLDRVGRVVSSTEPVQLVLDQADQANRYGDDVVFIAADGQASGQLTMPERPADATRTTVQYGNAYVSKPTFPVLSWLMNTIKVAGISAMLILLLSTTSAYAFGRLPFKGKGPMLKSLLVIQMFPNTLFLVALYLLFDKLGGFVDFLALNTHSALIIGYMGGLALNIFMVIGYFDTIDPAMEESAAIDGATPFQTFYKILLPLSVPILAVVFILAFIGFVNEFPLASVIISDLDKMTLAVGAQQYIQDQSQLWGDFAAAAVLSGVPITIVFLIAQRFLVGGLTSGGVKG